MVQLEDYVKEYKIFIDTCSLLENIRHTENFFRCNKALLLTNEKKIYIPLRVVQEIEKHSKNSSKWTLMKIAERVYDLLGIWQKEGIIEICGNNQFDNFADNAFLTAFTALRVNSKLLLITQDRNLSKDVLSLNNSLSVQGMNIEVLRFNRRGELETFNTKRKGNGINRPYIKALGIWQPKVPRSEEIFVIRNSVTEVADTPIMIERIPQAGDTVYDEQHRLIQLRKELAAGGEGCIYAVDKDMVAKIYKAGKLTRRKSAKLQLLTKKRLSCSGICFPQQAVYNSYSEFVGYLMPAAKGYELQRSIFVKPLFLKRFPNWKKKDLVQLALTILYKFKYLHDRNIIVGDINPGNILVADSQEVYFVDTDSYQIEDFPCPVGTSMFTAKELQGKSYEDYLRTKGNENFALATLLFMLMVPGKPPYAHQGGEGIIENIRLQRFPYQLGYKKGEMVPDGAWRFIWSHLPYKIKEAFYETFQRGGKYAHESSRLSVDDWLQLFLDYYENLSNGNMEKNDSMSLELFPTRFKKEKWGVYKYCEICGKEAKKDFGKDYIICFDCSQKEFQRKRCVKCGEEFIVTMGEKMFLESKGAKIPESCKECKKRAKSFFRFR